MAWTSAPPDAPVRFFAYVGTLDRRIGRGDPRLLERIGRLVGELSHREKEPMTLLAALPGGFVELDAAAVRIRKDRWGRCVVPDAAGTGLTAGADGDCHAGSRQLEVAAGIHRASRTG